MVLSKRVMFGLVLLHLIQMYLSWDQLPRVVASHFGGDNLANGFATKGSYYSFYLVILAVVVGVFAFLTPLARKMPKALVNIPKKKYWMATPERREHIFKILENHMGWLGVATVAFLMFVFHMVLLANRIHPPHLPPTFLWGFGAYIGGVLGWCLYFILRFSHFETLPE